MPVVGEGLDPPLQKLHINYNLLLYKEVHI